MLSIGPGLHQSGADRTGRLALSKGEPSVGKGLCTGRRRIVVERCCDLTVQSAPLCRRPVVVVVLPLLPGFVAVVLPHHVEVVHAHCLDDLLKDERFRRRILLDRVLGACERFDRAIDRLATVLEHLALLTERGAERQRRAVENRSHLLQGDAERLEGDDLFEAGQVTNRVRAIAVA